MGTVNGARHGDWIRADDPSVVGAARRAAAELGDDAGLDPDDAGRMALAVSEVTSNLVKHATDGMVLVRPHPEAERTVELVAIDRGPGIPDLERVLRDGYSTSGTLGIGMSSMIRNASGFDIYSLPGRGTVLSMHFTPRGTAAPALRASGLTRPIGEETVCGDAYAFVVTGEAITALLCDGLGHGLGALEASQAATEIFLEAPGEPPAAIVERVHRGLAATRGGAVAVARIAADTVSFCGLGNVSGWIVDGQSRHGMLSTPGIAGHQSRRLRQYEYAAPPHAVVVLHSDGLTERWDAAATPGLFTRSPAVVAAALLRDAAGRRDDACVVTVRLGDDAH
ncbi:ATP-binding protein [Streptosporangiaceae bacterium NEAU-GS5]|nr:ATP-binding protein [Streptosporangiaceae bacterium NEAU-GS5]